jgi:molybdenum ABC transporter molybdate-binding protein
MNFWKIFLATFFLLTSGVIASPSRNLTILSEPNMVMALTKIGRLYSQKSNVTVSINFNSSAELVSEVDYGEPADVFISAHYGSIEAMHHKGLVDVYNIGYIARDDLVLTTNKLHLKSAPKDLKKKGINLEEALRILDSEGLPVITDNEGNSSGNLSLDIIKKFNFNNIKICKRLSEDKTPFLTLVRNNKESYALMFASQVKDMDDLEVLAKKNDENIFYQALVIAGDNMDVAREFLKFLKSKPAKKILRENGFITD